MVNARTSIAFICIVVVLVLLYNNRSFDFLSTPNDEIPNLKPAAAEQDWNILYHLAGDGPWIQKIDGVVEGGIEPPKNCRVEQVHMMSRHAERYPTIRAGIRMVNLVDRLKGPGITTTGPLTFVKDWEYFSADPQANLEQLTTTGPYAGVLEAFATGVKLRTRYMHLFPNRFPPGGGKTKFWASDARRVVDSARYFAAGFFGIDWKDVAELHAIPETSDLGGDTLTPGDTCSAYLDDAQYGHAQGAAKLIEFTNTYLPAIAERLETYISVSDDIHKFTFTKDEVYALQEMCGFETIARGTSPWCNVFTRDEWESFEYARDVMHFYRAGPGTKYAAAMGALWLNATARLLATPSAGPFFFSFVHDGDINPMLAALDLFHDDEPLPVTHIAKDRKWRTSQHTPMGGRVIFERMDCEDKHGETAPYIRVNINDGIVAIPECDDGPGRSCPYESFLKRLQVNQEKAGDFKEICGLGNDAPDRITFLHQ